MPDYHPDLVRQDGYYRADNMTEGFEILPNGSVLMMKKEIYYNCRHKSRGFRKICYVDIDTDEPHIKTEHMCLTCKREMKI
jgi:hypothetical protein